MRCKRIGTVLLCAFAGGMGAVGCDGAPIESEELTVMRAALTTSTAIGDFLPGLQVSRPGLLAEARDAFLAQETIQDGVGPIFNERACVNCHFEGAPGGA